MRQFFGIGIGAGLASALLFAVISTQNPLSLVLYLVAPLPILIVALGWNHRAGLVASVTGSGMVALLFSPLAGIVFAASVALPAWWIAYLALLARNEGGTAEWYPLGRLVLWIALVSAALTVLGARLLGSTYKEFLSAFEQGSSVFEQINPNAFEGIAPETKTASLREFSHFVATIAPPVSAAASVATTVLLLWAAARIVKASGRLPRPWPYLPAVALPGFAVAVLATAIVAGIALPGFLGLAGRSLAAAVGLAYCLQGLAVIHVLTLGLGGRVGILSAVYVVIFILPGWPLVLYALVGLADSFLGFRARRLPPPAPPPTIT
jgi:hypothetical protein